MVHRTYARSLRNTMRSPTSTGIRNCSLFAISRTPAFALSRGRSLVSDTGRQRFPDGYWNAMLTEPPIVGMRSENRRNRCRSPKDLAKSSCAAFSKGGRLPCPSGMSVCGPVRTSRNRSPTPRIDHSFSRARRKRGQFQASTGCSSWSRICPEDHLEGAPPFHLFGHVTAASGTVMSCAKCSKRWYAAAWPRGWWAATAWRSTAV